MEIKHKVKERYCEYCGEKLQRNHFPGGRWEDVAVFNKRKYCNRMCMRKAFLKAGRYDQDWSSAHETARNINNLILKINKCEICGKEGKLDVHHKDDNEQNNNPDNLMVLCRSCHMKIHRPKAICTVDGCENFVDAHGYCSKHNARYIKYGSPFIVNRGSGNFVEVDAYDKVIRKCQNGEINVRETKTNEKKVCEKAREYYRTHKAEVMARAAKRKKPIVQYSKEGEFIKEWDSARDVQNELGYFESAINKCCNGHIKSYKGYVWKYLAS